MELTLRKALVMARSSGSHQPSAISHVSTRRSHQLLAISRVSALVVVALALTLAPIRAADTLPELTNPVNDFARVIDPESAREMDRMIRALQAATGDVVVVATVPTIEPFGDIIE